MGRGDRAPGPAADGNDADLDDADLDDAELDAAERELELDVAAGEAPPTRPADPAEVPPLPVPEGEAGRPPPSPPPEPAEAPRSVDATTAELAVTPSGGAAADRESSDPFPPPFRWTPGPPENAAAEKGERTQVVRAESEETPGRVDADPTRVVGADRVGTAPARGRTTTAPRARSSAPGPALGTPSAPGPALGPPSAPGPALGPSSAPGPAMWPDGPPWAREPAPRRTAAPPTAERTQVVPGTRTPTPPAPAQDTTPPWARSAPASALARLPDRDQRMQGAEVFSRRSSAGAVLGTVAVLLVVAVILVLSFTL